MVYRGPYMWIKSNEDSIPVMQVMSEHPEGMSFSKIRDEVLFDKNHLMSLLFKLRELDLVESFRRTSTRDALEWRITPNGLMSVSRIMMREALKTTSKPVSGVA